MSLCHSSRKETEKRKNEKTLDLKRDGCLPYVFKVYVNERSLPFEYNFQIHLHSFQRACGDISYIHTHQREGERINDARVIHRKKKKKKKNRKSAREEKGSTKEAQSIG